MNIFSTKERYTRGNKLVGLTKSHTVYTSGARRKRAAMATYNKKLDTIKITQVLDEVMLVHETNVETPRYKLLACSLISTDR